MSHALNQLKERVQAARLDQEAHLYTRAGAIAKLLDDPGYPPPTGTIPEPTPYARPDTAPDHGQPLKA